MSKKNKRPNILCFLMDQLRYDYLGCMGNKEIKTPNIDRLANNGVTFDRAYVANPLCMPARSTLFTGRTPRSHGVRTNGIPLDEDVPTLPQALSKAGYRTHSVGKLHLSNFGVPDDLDIDDDEYDPYDFPERRENWLSGKVKHLPEPYYGLQTTEFVGGHGFDVYGDYLNWLQKKDEKAYEKISLNHPENEYQGAPQTYSWAIPEERHYNHWIADKTCQFLEKEGDQPFFLWCSFPDPHHPYVAPEPWGSMYDPEEVSTCIREEGELNNLPPFYKDAFKNDETLLSGLHGKAKVDENELRKMIAKTYGMISFVDNEIGRVLDRLEEQGLRENTIVVFLSDHGDMMGDHWMVRKGPFQFEGLLRMPMIWSWPGHFSENTKTKGLASQIDFAPTVLDLCNVPIPEGPVPETVEAEEQVEPWPGQSLRPQLEGELDKVNEHVIIENDEDYIGLRIRTFITDRYKLNIYPGEDYGQLYDLKNDPDELNNLWEDSEYIEIKNRLLKEFLESYILQDSALPRRMSHA